MEKYCAASGDRFSYMAVAVSNDKPDDLVLVMGYKSAEIAEIADKVFMYIGEVEECN